jgi:hypothetical protein
MGDAYGALQCRPSSGSLCNCMAALLDVVRQLSLAGW